MADETCIRHDQPVEFQKVRGRCNGLGGPVLESAIAGGVHTEGCEAGHISEPENSLYFDFDRADFVLDAAWPNRFQRKPVAYFSQRTVTLQTRIKNLKLTTGAPASVRTRAAERLSPFPDDPPNHPMEGLGVESLEGIENGPIVNTTATRHNQV